MDIKENTMKNRKSLKIGDRVRAWDHEEREGVRAMFVVGTITEIEDDMILVDVEIDTVFEKGARTQIRTPLEMIFGDWDKRIELAPKTNRSAILISRDGNGDVVFWTGKAGQNWISIFITDAFVVTIDEGEAKIALFNLRTKLTGLTFSVLS